METTNGMAQWLSPCEFLWAISLMHPLFHVTFSYLPHSCPVICFNTYSSSLSRNLSLYNFPFIGKIFSYSKLQTHWKSKKKKKKKKKSNTKWSNMKGSALIAVLFIALIFVPALISARHIGLRPHSRMPPVTWIFLFVLWPNCDLRFF